MRDEDETICEINKCHMFNTLFITLELLQINNSQSLLKNYVYTAFPIMVSMFWRSQYLSKYRSNIEDAGQWLTDLSPLAEKSAEKIKVA